MILTKWEGLLPNNTMKKFIICTIVLLTSGCSLSFGQNAHFMTSGVITYEKTINMYALFRKDINKDNESFLQPAYEQYKKNQPQFKKLKSTLTFGDNRTLFTPVEDDATNNGSFWGDDAMVNQNNTTFIDLLAGTLVSQKQVFE